MDAERWKQVDQLLESALGLPPERREEFLHQACRGDAALEEEVRSLLKSHQNLGNFLEGPAIKAAAHMIALAEARESGDAMLGQTIAHYRVLSKLGSGGMGIVYEAEDIRLGRRVALKLLPENLTQDKQTLQRFEREARVASSLNHPNICTIYEVEEHHRQPVIVMELLEGVSLKHRIDERPLTIDELLDFGIQTAGALEAAHSKGIIHRDIKPGNIYVVAQGRVKILDFGLAKMRPTILQEGEADEEALTLDGIIPGTTSYMSPEQLRGEEIDARSDLFSLGVVLYEMATGCRPFVAKNRIMLMNAILNAQPARASKANPSLPAGFDAIIAKALVKDREKRFQHAAEICSDLKRLKKEREKRPWLRNLQRQALALDALSLFSPPYETASRKNQRSSWRPVGSIFLCSEPGLWGVRKK
jgi:non-specific serine/threonine protein kinase